MKIVNSLGNRLVAWALSIVMVLGMFPVGTVTAVGDAGCGNVYTLTGGFVKGNGTENVEVLIEETTLQWSAANQTIGRYQDGWWVGIDVAAPENYSESSTYKVKSGPTVDYGEPKLFVDKKDGEKNIQLWFPVSPESLKKFASENRNLTMTYAFDWNGDSAYEQTIVFSVNPKGNIVLMKDGTQVYPIAGTVSTYTGGTVAGNGTANVEVIVEKTTLQWVPANSLRAEGWWVGIDVVAPEQYSANATYKVKNGPTSDFGAEKSFAANKDGEKDIQLWFPVSPESLTKFAAENRNLTMTYAFDWDADGSTDQTIVFSVKPSMSIVLQKDGKVVYPLGTVKPLTGGTVTGNGTANVEVVVEETTLQWVSANSLRAEGWWVGIDVVAPVGFAENATYKVKNSPTSDFGAEKSFAANRDGENDIQLWFPVSPESLKKFSAENRNLTMTYAFDWDGDGIYDQTIVFSVDPKGNIVLKKGAVQHYPEQGNVSTYTGGTVSGNKTGDISVVIDEVVLQWSPAEPAIGRLQNGWWVGIRVEAPVGFDATTLQNAKYQTKSNPNINWDDIAEVKNFWTNKDSNDSESVHYIQLWFPVTPASLEKFQNENRNITMVYRFDWNGDGEYDQFVTFSVVPSEKIVLTKVEQNGFAFEEANPVDQWVGASYTNIAFGGEGIGAVTYAITAGADVAEIDAVTGKLTFKKVGTVQVTATKAADDTYAEATATYTVQSIKYPQAEFKFENSNANITVEYADGKFANTAFGGSGEGTITYAIVSGNDVATIDPVTGEITFLKAGEIVVAANKEADENYEEATATYTLTIEKSEQSGLVVVPAAPDTITYSKDPQLVISVTGGSGNGDVTYSIIAGDEYATVDSKTGKITTLKAGGYFTIQVDKAGDDGYNAAEPVTATLYVEYAEQSNFTFATQAPAGVTFNDNDNRFSNVASGGESTGVITYAFVDAKSDTIADIDAVTGEIIIHAAGTVNVIATKAGDDCYSAITAEYSLTIDKDTPEFAVKDVELVYGTTEYVIDVETALGGSGAYRYSIEGENKIGASVSEDGVISFAASEGKVGTITVKVTKEADEQYIAAEKSFAVTVSYHTPAARPEITGAVKNESGWYTGEVTIAAPDGYLISYSNELEGSQWSDVVTINTNGVHAKDVYLKKGDEISGAISFDNIKIDTEAPGDVDIRYDTPFLETVLQTITFGIYQADTVTVILTATDAASGVDYFTYNIGGEDIVVNKADFTKNKKGVAEYQFTISAQYRNKVTMKATDVAGWTSELTETKHTLVVDDSSPELEVKYEFVGSSNMGDPIYSNNAVTVIFEISEANFDLRAKDPVLKVNEMTIALAWVFDEVKQVWTANQTLVDENTYSLSLTFTDASGNEMTPYEKTVIIDREPPVIVSTYQPVDAVQDNVFNAARIATFTITERNFSAKDVILTVTAEDITGKPVTISSKAYKEYAQNPDNWTNIGDVYTIELPVFDIDAIYTVDIEYTDLAKNEAKNYTADEFVVDQTAPENIQILYSEHIRVWDQVLNAVTFGYYSYQKELEVTIVAEDATSGVDFFKWSYTQEENSSEKNMDDETKVISKDNITYSNDGKTATASFKLKPQARGYISVEATDKANNTGRASDDNRINIVDDIAPSVTVSYNPDRVLYSDTLNDAETYTENDNVILYYEKSAVVTVTIDEANFYAEDVVVTVSKNGIDSTPNVVWTDESANLHTGIFTISGDGDYRVKVDYTDRSSNKMDTYTSKEIRIDDTDPVISVETVSDAEVMNGKYYKSDLKAIITIVDHNFIADDVVAEITAVDVQGNKIADADKICADYAAYLKSRDSWKSEGDVHTAEITFTADAHYTVKLDYKDIVGNDAQTYEMDPFVVDHAAPNNLKIEYSESVVGKIIEAITFGFYEPKVVVTITAEDTTSGVDFFEWRFTKEDSVSGVNNDDFSGTIKVDEIKYIEKGLKATATFEILADARGYVSATATDRAGNSVDRTDKDVVTVVVDDLAPTISVEYKADDENTKVQFVDENKVTVGAFSDAHAAYYNGDVTAKIAINEANFFEGVSAVDAQKNVSEVIHNVGIKLTVTDYSGVQTTYEYLPAGAVQKYPDATPIEITWMTVGDEHAFSINYSENADYVLEIEYADLSANDANISANDGNSVLRYYKSKTVTVDKIAPLVSVQYSNDQIIHTVDDRDYFDAKQTATITVQEHNFRAEDLAATITAKNILGDDVSFEPAFEWTHEGDTHTITITYDVDANYSFDYVYMDLALNAAADYEEDRFTVDTTAPENLTVEYSTSVLDQILESITFGYYNAEMTVTISAEDDTAGIYYFVYSYIKGEDVSDVNAELLNEKIEDANNRIVRNGKKSTASFTIPKLVLENDNQFNGTVKFTAYDRSENDTEKADDRIVVVDNIAPTATITYNQPVQNVNGISYYAGNIDASITINEANFYSEDVVVKVTKDGADYPVNVRWTDESVDIHTGRFTLTDDGDYVVTVEYKDRSENEMTKYTSNRLTLDTIAPTVQVSNIKMNSANKDEKYGFTITANDINLDAASFMPELKVTVRKDDGTYETKTVSLGEMNTAEAGKTYTFTVDNLEQDGIYALACTLKDLSGNQYFRIALSDGKEYDEVKFSINRDGSTFAVDQNTDTLVNQYYVYSVGADIVIEEVNVDPVETYVVKLNGKALTEGTDYTTTLSAKNDQWSKRTYIISKNLFEAEGEYSIVVESKDKTNTTAYSDVKNLNVSFVVDQTAPVLTVSGLENGGRYQVDEQTVTVIPVDDGGRLHSMKVIVLNSDGEPLKDANGQDISVRFTMSGEEFLAYLEEHAGKVTFTVPEGLENQVQIICDDYAVNVEGQTNTFNETYAKVTVSQSKWIIFYANKPLFYGAISGIVLLISGIIFLIVLMKKKKESKK